MSKKSRESKYSLSSDVERKRTINAEMQAKLDAFWNSPEGQEIKALLSDPAFIRVYDLYYKKFEHFGDIGTKITPLPTRVKNLFFGKEPSIKNEAQRMLYFVDTQEFKFILWFISHYHPKSNPPYLYDVMKFDYEDGELVVTHGQSEKRIPKFDFEDLSEGVRVIRTSQALVTHLGILIAQANVGVSESKE